MPVLVQKASAGSGKTFNLVFQFLLETLRDRSPSRFTEVLALTFTNKAAQEMKGRILSALAQLSEQETSGEKKDAMKLALLQELKLPEQELHFRASSLLKEILFRYDEFRISTIDAFMYSIVRSFAFELRQATGFEVIMDQKILIHEAVHALIRKAGTDDEITAILKGYLIEKTNDEGNWSLIPDMQKFAGKLFEEKSISRLGLLEGVGPARLLDFKRELSLKQRKFKEKVEQFAQLAKNKLKSLDIEAEDLRGGANGIGKLIYNLSEDGISKFQAPLNKTVLTAKDPGKEFSENGKKKHSGNQTLVRKILDEFFEKYDSCVQEFSEIIIGKELQKGLFSTAVLSLLKHELELYKKESKSLHISDFNRLIFGEIRNEPVPYIYHRIGARLRHFLLDEFQDTSALQWLNLIPLLANGLASEGKVFIVGDAKQAIYRWRNGSSAYLLELPALPESEDSLIADENRALFDLSFDAQFNPPNRNYRSIAGIVRFNNAFFSKVRTSKPDIPMVEKIYSGQEQEISKEDGGFVYFNTDNLDKKSFQETYLPEFLATLNDLIESQKYQLRDIAVLVRNKDDGETLARLLSGNKIPVISNESLLIISNSEVSFITDCLKFALNPNNSVAETGLECWVDTVKLPEGFVPFAQEDIQQLKRYLLYSGADVYKTVSYIVSEFKLLDISSAYVSTFIDQVVLAVQLGKGGPGDFLNYWEENGANVSLNIPEETNAVKIITIHKAKGLEFPVVMMPLIAGDFGFNSSELLWVHVPETMHSPSPEFLIRPVKALDNTELKDQIKAEESEIFIDNLNLLYVAFTRAKERLYVWASSKKDNSIGKYLENILSQIDLKEHVEIKNDGERFQFWYGQKEYPRESLKISEPFEGQFLTPVWKTFDIRLAVINRSNKEGDINSPRAFGIWIHSMLANYIPGISVKKLMESHPSYYLNYPEEIVQKGSTMLQKTIDLIQDTPFADPETIQFAEQNILLPKGSLLRPDRMVYSDGKIHILDFKTGEFAPEHATRIKTYAETMRQAGYQTGNLYLLYIEQGKLNLIYE